MKSFLAGLGVGALIGLAIAPKAGAETRQELLDAANERFGGLRDDVQERYENLRDEYAPRVAEIKQQVGEKVDAVRERVSGAADQVANARDRVIDSAKEKYEAVANRGLLGILNDWPHDRLIEIPGIGPVLAAKIIENRPYKSEDDLVESKILPPSAIDSLRKAA